ncbi:MAG TPA: hypothetical protein DEA49_04995 [Petrotoga sp.]|nr:MAG: Uncharacterized protein XD53_1851 [Petrotoga mobilis]HBT51452.1 hypothetical protein [Petrotoga sp.]
MQKKEILFLADHTSIYTKNLLSILKKKYNEEDFSVLSHGIYFKNGEKIFERRNHKNKLLKLLEIKKMAKKIRARSVLMIHIHFLSPHYFFYRKIFKNTKVIITFWGSDLYRVPKKSKINKFLQKQIIKKADIVTVAREKMIADFHKIFGFENKPIYVTRFPIAKDLKLIDSIKEQDLQLFREKYGVKDNDFIITLGYSSDPGKNHEYMIDEIVKLNQKFKNLFIIIPMTYGNSEHREKIKKYCEENLQKNNIQYVILENYMDNQEVAILRKITDVMINVQNTDALSASMMETLFAENIVINGDWLNYDELLENGVYFETIPELKSGVLSSKVEYILNNYNTLKEKTKVNKEIIYRMNNLDDIIEDWLKVYNMVLED